MNSLSIQAEKILSALHNAGFEAFAVGGYVRDMLMDKDAFDVDITTNATPDIIKEVFSSYRTVDTGIKHGTVTVIVDGAPIEITTYRIEKGYSDSRHPDSVLFTSSLTDDLSRRDFTVNSIAYSAQAGFIDPFSGMEDIKKRLIRCVGEPEKRFSEDALRILRALRFASTLSFEIEEETSKAILKYRHLLKNISQERIFSETVKILCGDNVRKILTEYIEVFEIIIPEIKNMKGFDQRNFHHIYDVLTHTATVVENTPPLPPLRLAALFHDCAKPDCFSEDENGIGHFYSHASLSAKKAEQALIRLRCDTRTKEKVVKLVKIHDTPIEESERIVKKKLQSYGEELFFDLLKLQRADTKGLAPEFHSREKHFDTLEKMAKDIIISQECFSIKDLSVNGNDLIDLGLKGKEIGNMLNFLLDEVMEGNTPNEKEKLLNLCENRIE